jgi:hypothetical protein
VPSDIQAHALGTFFRALAERIEGDPAFAQSMLGAAERGRTEHGARVSEGGAPRAQRRPRSDAKPPPPRPPDASRDASRTAPAAVLLDPYAVLREHGEAALRVRLGELDLASLRTIVRTHRFDPARLSARWTARERLIDLIAEQVGARSHLGRAFERV